ncbi:MAG: hypothetical protein PUK75_12190 [bacterium]|nr:hypothetical protein [bacterium]MDY4101184.1 hypothetical protein [Lachnospiraceae bacterium]
MDSKKKIYYARTYRRLQIRWERTIVLACLLILPTTIIFLMMLDALTDMITRTGTELLSKVIAAENMHIVSTAYSILSRMSYIKLSTVYPTISMILWNMGICFLLLLLIFVLRKGSRPFAIFSLFAIVIHMVSCMYFLFAADRFPYTAGQYSELYLKQQTGIWLTFIVLAGLVTTFIGENGYFWKLVTFLSIIAYSLIFGAVRYILFLFILYRYSVLYMALLFFVFGPMFDYSYFVAIYAIFVNKNINDYEFGKKKGVWKWS